MVSCVITALYIPSTFYMSLGVGGVSSCGGLSAHRVPPACLGALVWAGQE